MEDNIYKPLATSTLERKTKEELISLIRFIEDCWVKTENELYELQQQHDKDIINLSMKYEASIKAKEEQQLIKHLEACEKREKDNTNYKELIDTHYNELIDKLINQPLPSSHNIKEDLFKKIKETTFELPGVNDMENKLNLKESIDKLADDIRELAEASTKKKTCWNCAHHHDTLAGPEGKDFWHIHDYCDAWDKSSICTLHSKLCKFLDNELHEVIEDVMTRYGFDDSYFIDDDFEIGQAGCYRFEDNEEPSRDEEMKKNFEHDRELALKVVNVILDKMESGDAYDKDEHDYYEQWKEEIENMKFED